MKTLITFGTSTINSLACFSDQASEGFFEEPLRLSL